MVTRENALWKSSTSPSFSRTISNQVHPVILSGGAGATLWPLAPRFQQLLPLVSEQTLLQEAVARTSSDAMFTTPIVICNEDHRFLVDEQLKQMGISPLCSSSDRARRPQYRAGHSRRRPLAHGAGTGCADARPAFRQCYRRHR